MELPAIQRRSFLALGVGALAWACARGGDDPEGTDTDGGAVPGAISIIMTAPQGLVPGDTRQAFAILGGQKPIAPDDVRAKLTSPGADPFDIEVTKQEIVLGPGGESGDEEHPPGSEVTHIYSFRHDFDRTGIWELSVSFTDNGGGSGSAQFQIAEETRSPEVGAKALATDSPTTDDPKDVDPICTRDPLCSMHDVTITEAIEEKKPAVLVFATPRFCTSRTCGPIVDLVEQAKERFGNEANFVHVEVWKNDKDAIGKVGGESPAFAEWKLDTEPWIFFVDSTGVIRDRWIGAVGEREITDAVAALLD
ncbi:MAG: hypothetical protein WD826_11455 [Actinomycetota bacterium]